MGSHFRKPASLPPPNLYFTAYPAAMSSVESAASLFGSDDASPDPFAVLGDDSETTTDSTNAVHGETPSLDDKPDAGVAAAGLYGLEDSSASAQYSSELKSSSHDPYAYDTSAYSQDTSNGVSYNDQEVQGWYDEHGQWQMHQNLPTQPAEAGERIHCQKPTRI